MRILFTSVGRRVELVQSFRTAAQKACLQLEIIGADISLSAPALFFCDRKVRTPRISDPEYIPFLTEYCEGNGIDALIPTIDTDLQILAENKELFGNTRVIVSSADAIRICRDKRLTGEFFKKAGVDYPQPVDDYKKYDKGYPAFIKPKDGSSSINAYKVSDSSELETLSKMVPDYIVQPFIRGKEYTVDVFCDFNGIPIYITPRIRLAVRSGEVLKTQICQDKRIISEVEAIVAAFKPCGPMTIQLIRETASGKDYYIEINPRFGGGAPLSIKAGADSSEALLRLLMGERCDYYGKKVAKDGEIYSRFDQSILVNG